jgi:serpin B
MKTLIAITAILFLMTNSMAQKSQITESINRFSFKIQEQVHNDKENCIYSPFSIFGALSMTYAGARENTKLEMEKALEINDKAEVHHDFLELSSSLGFEREISFLSSNSLWLQKSLKPEKDYVKLIEEMYKAKVENVNFSNETDREKSRVKINDLIDNQTKGMLPNFIPKGFLDESTIMVLINAIYFNSLWQNEFPSDKVSTGSFMLATKDSVPCKMMNIHFETNYYEDSLMQLVEIPYQNRKASMLVFLPKIGAKATPSNFNYEYFKKICASMSARQLTLALPKFKISANYELSESLKNIGMKSSFAPGADFSGITGNKSLILDKVLHKSVIDVSEKGTEAASSTAVISMRSTKIEKEPAVFIANRPFYFLIKQNPGNLILLMGYLAKPE